MRAGENYYLKDAVNMEIYGDLGDETCSMYQYTRCKPPVSVLRAFLHAFIAIKPLIYPASSFLWCVQLRIFSPVNLEVTVKIG